MFLPRDTEGSPQVRYGIVSFRLESKSSDGSPAEQMSNRAELRAVIAALQFRSWYAEGWKRIVIATDLEYAINGATEWVDAWVRKNWITSKKVPVKNRDLWELLMQEIRRFADKGVEVLFWKIPRRWNTEADTAAKDGAAGDEVAEFMTISGILNSISGDVEKKGNEMVWVARPWVDGKEPTRDD